MNNGVFDLLDDDIFDLDPYFSNPSHGIGTVLIALRYPLFNSVISIDHWMMAVHK